MIEYITDPIFIKSLYPNGLTLDSVIVDSILFKYDGPSIEISLQSKSLPDNPPEKWKGKFNRVKIVLNLLNVCRQKFDNWGKQNICTI
jgi:hypothetical protein